MSHRSRSLGLASLLEDVRVAQTATGFRHYLANASLTRLNTFVLDQPSLVDVVDLPDLGGRDRTTTARRL